MVGETISHYRIVEKLGEGGMGVVYKAEDTQLRRTVALKFLGGQAVANEEVRIRLIREAQASASLDHPNICPVYGIHEYDGETFIAMAYIDGPSLADRIKERPLPLDESLKIATQIAEGLQEAHEKGIVHRDIKPQNVMLTAKGQVKIMDFGLASLAGRSKITKSGTTLGTPAYMAPEQLEAGDVDRRADIWALGCVLYEMLTQQTPFEAEYEQAIAYGILNEAPEPVSAKRSGLPIEIDRILEKTLAKNSSERYQHTGDLVVDLRRVAKDRPGQLDRGSTSSKSSQSQSAISDRTLWKYRISLAACLLGFSGVLFLYLWQRPDPSPLRRFGLLPPVDVASYPYSANVAISPNGRHVAFVAGEGEGGLWVRDFDQERPRLVEGTAGALMPFWSPDSEFIGFVSDGELKKVPVVGGTPARICEMSGSLFGGASWSPDGQTIVFGDRAPGVLFEVSAGGGEPRVFLDGPQLGKLLGEEVGYLGRPHFLSAGSEPTAILFTASRPNWGPSENRLVAYSLRSTSAKVVGLGDFPSYSPTGHIVHQNGFSLYDLWALPFDPESLETRGDAFLIAEAGRGPSVSVEGTLVYATESSLVPEQLIWVNRAGEKLRELGLVHGGMASPSLAPNGTMIGVNLKEGNEWGAYVFDTMRKRRTRISGISRADGLIWSASSERVAYRSLDSSTYDTALRWIGDERQEMVNGAELRGRLRDWSQDGQRLIYTIADPDTQWDIIYLQNGEKGTGWERHPFRTTRFDERLPRLSPDGRYIAYVSNESGRDEIYVESFPERGPREVVSVNGGTFPRWGRDGSELFYVQGDVLFAVSVTSEVDFEAGSTTRLFRHPGLAKDDGRPSSYDISADGQQILLAEQVDMGGSVVPPIRIVENWYEEFREREQNSPR